MRRIHETAFIAGSNLLMHPPFGGGEPETIATPFGPVAVQRGEDWAVVLRHGADGRVPPHRINHHANIDALRRLRCHRVVSFCSVGSLHPELRPGTLVVPDDFINLAPVLTFFDHDPPYATPALSEAHRRQVARALTRLGERFADGGVYYQTIGPRLETKAEIRMLSKFADVVGMTLGHEATLCAEAGIEIAAVCSVDNFAHGVGGAEVEGSRILATKAEQSPRFAAIARQLSEMMRQPAGTEEGGEDRAQ